ncbi:unnamed protein product [Adineta ricciae]|uniref:DOMON domain-containing protein n=1 Tax=Adineta ricciae TaxID=249248 RepID=A0A813T7C1_ADIRI|nr:unnamed protein product [Adineta ricciae]CAF1216853.1 unnamed protein product [Adineta ricciae]
MFIQFVVVLFVIQRCNGVTSPVSPFTTYQHTVELQPNVSDLWWTINEANQTILFELHIKTTGWIALGISPAGGMTGADIGVGWVEQSGTVRFLDEYATTFTLPLLDNSTDWFALQGREQNGWTAIQFTRALDTCDSMDVAIQSGTNHLIFAYGLVDPTWNTTSNPITYHQTRRGSYSLSLRSYSDPPLESKFATLNYFDFRMNNYTIPAQDTTYYCKVFRAPTNYTTKQHVIANKMLLNSTDISKIHHLLMYECDSTVTFNDSNLPSDICENIYNKIGACMFNIATGWAVGGDVMSEFPSDAGYPIGGNATVKYYVVQMHYTNSDLCTNCQDSSGLRFYVTDALRKYDIGYLTFGTDTDALSLTIPPQVETFSVDTYCPASATALFPASGITIINAFPHTHLQGKSIWTKIIRNKTAVGYLFNAETYDFNYQFNNRLPNRITIYPGDEFSTRCVYNTMNKNTTTFGGERTVDEMCLHMFTYFPRMENMSLCLSFIYSGSWANFLGINTTMNQTSAAVRKIASNMTWTSNMTTKWQNFYNNATRITVYGRGMNLPYAIVPSVSDYRDLQKTACVPRGSIINTSSATRTIHFGIWHVLIISTSVLSFLTKMNSQHMK